MDYNAIGIDAHKSFARCFHQRISPFVKRKVNVVSVQICRAWGNKSCFRAAKDTRRCELVRLSRKCEFCVHEATRVIRRSGLTPVEIITVLMRKDSFGRVARDAIIRWREWANVETDGNRKISKTDRSPFEYFATLWCNVAEIRRSNKTRNEIDDMYGKGLKIEEYERKAQYR